MLLMFPPLHLKENKMRKLKNLLELVQEREFIDKELEHTSQNYSISIVFLLMLFLWVTVTALTNEIHHANHARLSTGQD
jgi:hypothetical protein